MSPAGGHVQRAIRWGALGLATVILVAAAAGDADARARRARKAAPGYEPPFASIVVDGNSGATIQATNADSPRHPASLTKMMTLYMLFERLEAGKIKLNSELSVSPHAASQAPSKLGLKPGETIQVETAIRAIVTKSANDVAVIIGEALGGDEPSFARMMTAKARALGMAQTTYRNASGLPDDAQITTARDQALLGRALQDRFPSYFHYFNTRSFAFRGRTIRGHNRLLGSVDGVDGIKTGYVNASGFNIVTSVNRANRHIVAAVFGGRTASARDARVRSLIENNIKLAATTRTAPPVAEGTAVAETKLPAKPPAPQRDPREEAVATSSGGPSLGSTEPIKPIAVKTVSVQAGPSMTALSALPADNRKLSAAPASSASVTTVATIKSEMPPAPPGAAPGILGVLPASEVKPPRGPQIASAGDKTSVTVSAAPATTAATNIPSNAANNAAKARGGWMIQVGAFPDEHNAKERLSTAQSKAKEQLGQADPFTEKVAKGDKALYRARFAGLDKDQAENACKHLKRSEIPCMLLKN
jgi:D-alanyl-D-alanine carboxypeptidase